jgi:hypothetical protein
MSSNRLARNSPRAFLARRFSVFRRNVYNPRMSLKNFILKQAVNWKLRDKSQAQRDQILNFVEKDPELFKKIGEEIEKRKKGGESEMKATMEVMKKYRSELQKLAM